MKMLIWKAIPILIGSGKCALRSPGWSLCHGTINIAKAKLKDKRDII